jgi:hypothetical protein
VQEKETPIEVRSVDNSAVRASQIARINKIKVNIKLSQHEHRYSNSLNLYSGDGDLRMSCNKANIALLFKLLSVLLLPPLQLLQPLILLLLPALAVMCADVLSSFLSIPCIAYNQYIHCTFPLVLRMLTLSMLFDVLCVQ